MGYVPNIHISLLYIKIRCTLYSVDISGHFLRQIPDSPDYVDRLNQELSWLSGTKAASYILTVAYVCRNLQDIPYIIRGSAGSSLVVYLLGISDIDPVQYNIAPERFFHPRRTSLPDIDLDFPDNLRDQVFDRIFKLFPGRVARISNHVQYSDKGAIRQAIRHLGYRKHIPEHFILSDLVPGRESDAIEIASDLENTIRDVSLHCGGLVIFDSEIPDNLRTEHDNQIRLDKLETESSGYMKLDILSNISLTQLNSIDSRHPDSYPEFDEITSRLLSSGRSLGITQCESPAFQKLLRAIRPEQRRDIILCMALIRPASAWRAHRKEFLNDFKEKRSTDLMVYEDDATRVISRLTGLPGPESDEIRRAFIKQNYELTKPLRDKLETTEEGKSLIQDIEAFRTFSMCKSHSVSYGLVSWALAYHKAHNPRAFWKAALNHAKSMWRNWVHVEEAKLAGWNIVAGKRPFKSDETTLFVENTTCSLFEPDPRHELKKYGMWSNNEFFPECGRSDDEEKCSFIGLIGTHRMIKGKDGKAVTFATVGTSRGNFLDVVIDGAVELKNYHLIEGLGELYLKNGSESAKLTSYKLRRL